jgi:hypothetical protein
MYAQIIDFIFDISFFFSKLSSFYTPVRIGVSVGTPLSIFYRLQKGS